MLVPRITPYDTKIIPQMYKDGYILTAIHDTKIFWHRNEQEVYNEENQDKQAMYEKMKELKKDPLKWKAVEDKAYSLLTPEQIRSEACNFHKDAKVREIITGMVG